MRSYETMFILRPDMDEEAIEAALGKVQRVIEENGGSVDEVNRWGKKRLAYEIEKYQEGYYVVINYKGEPEVSSELDRTFRLSDDVLRHLIVKQEA